MPSSCKCLVLGKSDAMAGSLSMTLWLTPASEVVSIPLVLGQYVADQSSVMSRTMWGLSP